MPFKEPAPKLVKITKIMRYVIERPFYKPYVKSMGLKGDEKVLEYGSGAGIMSAYLARALPRGHLTCVDMSSTWMSVVKERLGSSPNVDFHLGSIATLPTGDGAYDCVVIHFVLHELDPMVRQEKLDALVARLKNGGRIFIREPDREWDGMPADEIKSLMAKAGMKEVRMYDEKVVFAGLLHRGIYEKTGQ